MVPDAQSPYAPSCTNRPRSNSMRRPRDHRAAEVIPSRPPSALADARSAPGLRPARADVLGSAGRHSYASKISFEHDRIFLDVRRQTLSQLFAKIHDHETVGEPHDEIHVVLDQQYGHAFQLETAQQGAELLFFQKAQPGSRFIQ